MADEDLYNLDDFQDPEVSNNFNDNSASKPEEDNENEISEKKKLVEESREISTKTNSDKQEIVPAEEAQKKPEISKFDDQVKEKEPKETKEDIKENSLDSKSNESGNELDNENENEESSNESQENEEEKQEENQISFEDFKERHDKMQTWAIEDDLDISARRFARGRKRSGPENL